VTRDGGRAWPAALGLGIAVAIATASALGADADLGQKVFAERCAPCHGETGGGDGPAAAALSPKPRNFRDPDFWRGRTAVQLELVVKNGKPGTLMAPFAGALSDAEIHAVVGYLQRTFRPPSH
jgi:mono/diheme cytochrome c family protein